MQFAVWYDIMPFGQWWDYAVRHIPNLLMVYRETPQKIFGIEISFGEHKSDVARIEAILVLGKVSFESFFTILTVDKSRFEFSGACTIN